MEIEFTDGTEERFKFADRSVSKSLKVKSHYLRIWLGKKVLVIDSANPHFAFKKKNRNNFKFITMRHSSLTQTVIELKQSVTLEKSKKI
ncbi:DUF3977 family protein [Lactococcus cremoris]|uniref:DUF3977 family protein n=1 Tax=Lactococcus lactis subsp. cremoris TaxID=1359 RepID=UPI0037C171B6